MRILLTVLVISSLALSGCGRLRDSKVNPGNWFGKDKPRRVATASADGTAEVNPLIPKQTSVFRKDKSETYDGTPIDQISSVAIERLPTGAIIHVVGVSLRQGAYEVRLTSATKGDPVDGVLTFTLNAIQPQDQPQGGQISRTINAAVFVSNEVLEGSRVVQVLGARNSVSRKR